MEDVVKGGLDDYGGNEHMENEVQRVERDEMNVN